jgi:serine/threonine protein kinase
VLVFSLLGENLTSLRRAQPDGLFPVGTALNLSLQALSCLEALHLEGYCHRDVKPSSLCTGLVKAADSMTAHAPHSETADTAAGAVLDSRGHVFLMDLGGSRLWLDERGRARPRREQVDFRGAVPYASINAHKRSDLGRRDDLWSWFYVLIDQLRGALPWRRYRDSRTCTGILKQHYISHPHELLAGLPGARFLLQCHAHIAALPFEGRPDYALLASCVVAARAEAAQAGLLFARLHVPYPSDAVSSDLKRALLEIQALSATAADNGATSGGAAEASLAKFSVNLPSRELSDSIGCAAATAKQCVPGTRRDGPVGLEGRLYEGGVSALLSLPAPELAALLSACGFISTVKPTDAGEAAATVGTTAAAAAAASSIAGAGASEKASDLPPGAESAVSQVQLFDHAPVPLVRSVFPYAAYSKHTVLRKGRTLGGVRYSCDSVLASRGAATRGLWLSDAKGRPTGVALGVASDGSPTEESVALTLRLQEEEKACVDFLLEGTSLPPAPTASAAAPVADKSLYDEDGVNDSDWPEDEDDEDEDDWEDMGESDPADSSDAAAASGATPSRTRVPDSLVLPLLPYKLSAVEGREVVGSPVSALVTASMSSLSAPKDLASFFSAELAAEVGVLRDDTAAHGLVSTFCGPDTVAALSKLRHLRTPLREPYTFRFSESRDDRFRAAELELRLVLLPRKARAAATYVRRAMDEAMAPLSTSEVTNMKHAAALLATVEYLVAYVSIANSALGLLDRFRTAPEVPLWAKTLAKKLLTAPLQGFPDALTSSSSAPKKTSTKALAASLLDSTFPLSSGVAHTCLVVSGHIGLISVLNAAWLAIGGWCRQCLAKSDTADGGASVAFPISMASASDDEDASERPSKRAKVDDIWLQSRYFAKASLSAPTIEVGASVVHAAGVRREARRRVRQLKWLIPALKRDIALNAAPTAFPLPMPIPANRRIASEYMVSSTPVVEAVRSYWAPKASSAAAAAAAAARLSRAAPAVVASPAPTEPKASRASRWGNSSAVAPPPAAAPLPLVSGPLTPPGSPVGQMDGPMTPPGSPGPTTPLGSPSPAGAGAQGIGPFTPPGSPGPALASDGPMTPPGSPGKELEEGEEDDRMEF